MQKQAGITLIHIHTLGRDCQGCYTDIIPYGFTLPSLPPETLHAFDELGLILRDIHQRMVAEGYALVDGRIKKL